MNRSVIRNLIILLIVVTNIGCDQITKKVARENVKYNEVIEVINHNLIITKVENKGAFLGLGDDLSSIYWNIIMLGLPLVVLIGMLIYLFVKRDTHPISIVAISFIVGGGLGNIIDRYLYQSVTDFLFIDLGFAHTGVFNMADVSVMVGVGIIIFQYFWDLWRGSRENLDVA